jgi:multidrug efflux system outer membrane protein
MVAEPLHARPFSRPPIIHGAALALAACLLAGCLPKVAETVKPVPDMPDAWSALPADGRAVTAADWWQVYDDPVLERLVEEALAQSADIAAAVARVDEARALVAITEADRRPVIDLNADANRSRISRRTGPLPPGAPVERNDYRLALNASYELDLWDRLRNATEAARAELLAAQAAGDTVRIAVAASVAQSYFTLRALDLQIATTQRTIDVRERALELQRKRVEAGVLAEFDLRQVEAELAGVRAQLPPLIGSREREEAALAVLLGRSPRGIMGEVFPSSPGPLPGGEGSVVAPADAGGLQDRDADLGLIAPVIPAGVPSELLLRRPDIVEAERRLAAANAQVAIARVAHFPSIALTGYLGTESAALGSLFSGPAGIWRAALALAQPIFAGGRLHAELETVAARERQALAHYQGAIQAAFRDVRSALASQAQARASFDAEQARVRALAETVRLAQLRYEGGLSSQIELLDAERNLLAAELNRIEALRTHRVAIAALLQALGGGWETATVAPAQAGAQEDKGLSGFPPARQ